MAMIAPHWALFSHRQNGGEDGYHTDLGSFQGANDHHLTDWLRPCPYSIQPQGRGRMRCIGEMANS